MILRVGALSNGRVNHPWVAPVEWASCPFYILFSGQDAHSTPIHYFTDATPQLRYHLPSAFCLKAAHFFHESDRIAITT
ncbi:hypothetical protein [Moorena sp. SIO3I8]|uniref:hypothetical protein n=1 Tax=Moorena sp. SIO3I8 TaxID=2607833 RepID=UPI0013C28CA7|nr:hypothetical protein [Moorena sp. SIO3I8]NEO07404.1 hypothetical protein [Moorena sp. SIO3I8]